MGGGLSPLWGLGMMLVWLIILIGVGYLIYRGLVSNFKSSKKTNQALEELGMDYVRGVLSEEEFEKNGKNLTRNNKKIYIKPNI